MTGKAEHHGLVNVASDYMAVTPMMIVKLIRLCFLDAHLPILGFGCSGSFQVLQRSMAV
jgi:hypothetical protein